MWHLYTEYNMMDLSAGPGLVVQMQGKWDHKSFVFTAGLGEWVNWFGLLGVVASLSTTRKGILL